MTLATGYDPTSFESRLYARWESSGVFQPMMKRGQHQPDRAGVDVAEDGPDRLVGRADVGAGGATDALERLAEVGVVAHRQPAVVEQHQVQLLRPVHADRQR